MNKLLDWYLDQMPKYIRRWENVEGYEKQVKKAKLILGHCVWITTGDFSGCTGLDLTGYE